MFSPLANPRVHLAAACLLAALTALLTYQRDLDLDFAASDTVPLIESSRITAPGDLGQILSERMMADSSFPGAFFRPVSTLSFSLDYALWRLNPFGYHLLNLFLHAIASALVLLIARRLTGGRLRTALVAGLLFATHPILVETVPAIARRQDMLEFVFCAAAYLLFLERRARPIRSRGLLVLSLGSFFLALGAKETAAYFPALVAAHVYFFSAGQGSPRRRRLVRALRSAAPYLLPLAAFFVWHTAVLRGTGSDFFGSSWSRIALLYVRGLFYPQDFLHVGSLLSASPARWTVLVTGCVLLATASRSALIDPVIRRTARLTLVWLLLPLVILLEAHCFDYRNLYTSVAPFTILIAVAGAGALNALRERRTLVAATGLGTACLALAISLVAYSPLLREYPGWREAGIVQTEILAKLSERVEGLPDDSHLFVHELPTALGVPRRQAVHALSLSYLRDYTIESWLRLCEPESRIRVTAERAVRWPGPPRFLDAEVRPRGDGAYELFWTATF